MASMRNVRRQLRQELLGVIGSGDGNLSSLIKIADHLMGRSVGYEMLIKTFLASEVNNGLSQLRLEGLIESTGKLWKQTEQLQDEDVDIISTRRMRRLRGELKAAHRMAYDHGRKDDISATARMLEIIEEQLRDVEKSEELLEVAAQ